MSLVPVQCFTCGKLVSDTYEEYCRLKQTMTMGQALDHLKIKRFCCRRIYITTTDILDHVLEYNNPEMMTSEKDH